MPLDGHVRASAATDSVGSNLGTLTLSHATPIGLLSTINFTMDATSAPADLTVDHLVVAATSPALAAVNLDSTGDAGLNDILDVSGVADNIVITGGTPLALGDSAAHAYMLKGGIIDAHADTGGVAVWLGAVALNSPNPTQTFIAGTGTDIVHVQNFEGDVLDFSKGGADTAGFQEARYSGAGLLTNGPTSVELYNSVLGWTDANDSYRYYQRCDTHLAGPVAFTNEGGCTSRRRDQHSGLLVGKRCQCFRLSRQFD